MPRLLAQIKMMLCLASPNPNTIRGPLERVKNLMGLKGPYTNILIGINRGAGP